MKKKAQIKAKYDISSKKLAEWGISIADFVENPQDAMFTAAEIGEDKGYGSEGVWELYAEIREDLGIDRDDDECLGDEGLEFTIDGKLPNGKALAIAKLEHEAREMRRSRREG